MNEVVSKLDSGELLGLVSILGTIVCGALGLAFAFFWQAQVTRRAEVTAALKQDMLNRGMSADEIRSVLEAGSEDRHEEIARNRPARVS
jgi:hypothetical protein